MTEYIIIDCVIDCVLLMAAAVLCFLAGWYGGHVVVYVIESLSKLWYKLRK